MEGKITFLLLIIASTLNFITLSSSIPSRVCEELVLVHGYPCIDHNITTSDGFILALHQIPWGKNSSSSLNIHPSTMKRPAVLLQHGLIIGSESWVLNRPDQSLSFILADEGFDVWMGNTRGSRWNHGHVTYTKHDKEYWDWSFDDMATYDLPAMIAYVRKISDVDKIFYIGHSQGTAIALAGFTEPAIARQVQSAVLFCPVAFLGRMTSVFALEASKVHMEKLVEITGEHEFRLDNKIGAIVLSYACSKSYVDCSSLLSEITGPNCCINMTRVREFLEWLPGSSSVKNMAHYAQLVRSGKWQKFDYQFKNILHYGSFYPPQYDLTHIPQTLSLSLYYGGMDALVNAQDVGHLAEILKNPTVKYIPHYAHGDFVLSVSAKKDVYDDVVDFLKVGLTKKSNV